MRDCEREIAELSAEVRRLEAEAAAIREGARIERDADGMLSCSACGAEVSYGTDRFCGWCGARFGGGR
ncbi:hypothetical protein EII22_08810 [Coriobacteriales bacterium OH1046]|nr:hypothetical protein EII22_08810 [Coriobacteriales bacterium OH1046]